MSSTPDGVDDILAARQPLSIRPEVDPPKNNTTPVINVPTTPVINVQKELMDLSGSLFFFIALYSANEAQCSKNPKYPLIESGEHPWSLCRALCAGSVDNRTVSQPLQ